MSGVIARERAERESHHQGSHLKALLNGRVLLLCFIYFLNTLVSYGVFLWLPRILRDASGYRGWRLSLATALPFVVALVGMVLIGRHSDRTGERKRHVAACAIVGAIGLVRGRQLSRQPAAPRLQLRPVAARSAIDTGRVLGHPADLSRGHGGGRGHRAHQFGWQPRRLRGADVDGGGCAA